VISAVFFCLDYRLLVWRRSGKEFEVTGDLIWKNLRRFSGWTCAGCVAGVAFVSMLWPWRNLEYESAVPGISRRQFYELYSSSLRYNATYHIFLPTHLLCVIYAMNMLLRRVSDHASHSYYNTLRDDDDCKRSSTSPRKRFDWRDCIGQYALYYWVRSMHVIAMLLCVLNIAARVVAAGSTAKEADIIFQAAAATNSTGGETDASRDLFLLTLGDQITRVSVSVSRGCECAALLLVLSGFVMFFPAIIVMFRRVERKLDKLLMEMCLRSDQGTAFLPCEFSPRASDGSETQTEMPIVELRQYLRDIQLSATAQRFRFLFCLCLVIVALAALVSNALFVAAYQTKGIRNLDLRCGRCDPSCQNVEYLQRQWFRFTPYLSLLVSLCSTLPLVFSLWLMTTAQDRAMLMFPSRYRTESLALQPTGTSRQANLKAERMRMGIDLQ
jgi:hypothetical protein